MSLNHWVVFVVLVCYLVNVGNCYPIRLYNSADHSDHKRPYQNINRPLRTIAPSKHLLDQKTIKPYPLKAPQTSPIEDKSRFKSYFKNHLRRKVSGSHVSSGSKRQGVSPRHDCTPKLDVAFVMGGCGDPSFKPCMFFAKRVIEELSQRNTDVHFGLVLFSKRAKGIIGFTNNQNTLDTLKDLDNIKYTERQAPVDVNAGNAMQSAGEMFKNARGGSKKIVVLLTGGKSKDDIIVPSNQLKEAGVELYGIGMGQEFVKQQLDIIASSSQNVYQLEPSTSTIIAEQMVQNYCQEHTDTTLHDEQMKNHFDEYATSPDDPNSYLGSLYGLDHNAPPWNDGSLDAWQASLDNTINQQSSEDQQRSFDAPQKTDWNQLGSVGNVGSQSGLKTDPALEPVVKATSSGTLGGSVNDITHQENLQGKQINPADLTSNDQSIIDSSNRHDIGNVEGNAGNNAGNSAVNTGNNAGNTGNNAGNTGNNGANTVDNGINTGNNGANTGNNGVNTGNNAVDTVNNGVNTGNNGVNTGNNGVNTGNNGANTGNNGVNTGNNGANTGNNGANTGNNVGNMGSNAGGNQGNSNNMGSNSGNNNSNGNGGGSTGSNTGITNENTQPVTTMGNSQPSGSPGTQPNTGSSSNSQPNTGGTNQNQPNTANSNQPSNGVNTGNNQVNSGGYTGSNQPGGYTNNNQGLTNGGNTNNYGGSNNQYGGNNLQNGNNQGSMLLPVLPMVMQLPIQNIAQTNQLPQSTNNQPNNNQANSPGNQPSIGNNGGNRPTNNGNQPTNNANQPNSGGGSSPNQGGGQPNQGGNQPNQSGSQPNTGGSQPSNVSQPNNNSNNNTNSQGSKTNNGTNGSSSNNSKPTPEPSGGCCGGHEETTPTTIPTTRPTTKKPKMVPMVTFPGFPVPVPYPVPIRVRPPPWSFPHPHTVNFPHSPVNYPPIGFNSGGDSNPLIGYDRAGDQHGPPSSDMMHHGPGQDNADMLGDNSMLVGQCQDSRWECPSLALSGLCDGQLGREMCMFTCGQCRSFIKVGNKVTNVDNDQLDYSDANEGFTTI